MDNSQVFFDNFGIVAGTAEIAALVDVGSLACTGCIESSAHSTHHSFGYTVAVAGTASAGRRAEHLVGSSSASCAD